MLKLIFISIVAITLSSDLQAEDQRRSKRGRYITHIVVKGDNIYNIAKRYGVDTLDIKSANPSIGDDNTIKLGQIVRIDASKMGTKKASNDNEPEPQIADPKPRVEVAAQEPSEHTHTSEQVAQSTTSTAVSQAQSTATHSPQPVPSEPQKEAFIAHVVKKRETLYSLSRQYNVPILDINKANPDLRTKGLKTGSTVRIPVITDEPLAPPVVNESVTTDNTPVQDSNLLSNENIDSTFYNISKERRIKHFSSQEPIKATVLLPLQVDGKQSRQFAEFYQGMLIGLDSITRSGVSVDLRVLNTAKGDEAINRLISLGELDGSDVIIGPVYNGQFSAVAPYAAASATPIVSPLAEVDADNPYVYQIPASEAYRYDKLYDYLEDKRVIIYESSNDDQQLIAAIKSIASDTACLAFNNLQTPESIGEYMDKEKKNIFVVAAKDDQNIDMILSKLSSVKGTNYNKAMSVLGASNFSRSRVDRANFFKLDVSYISPYHVDRSDEDTYELDRLYIEKYNRQPSLFAYRGYDVALIVFGMMAEHGSEFTKYMDGHTSQLLRTKYKFVKDGDEGKIANSEFMLINYTPHFNIEVR